MHVVFTLVKVKSLSRVQIFATPWTVAFQTPMSMGFSRQVYWNGLPFSSPGDFPSPGIEPGSPPLQADSLPSEPPGNPLQDQGGMLPLRSCLADAGRMLLFLSWAFVIVVALAV